MHLLLEFIIYDIYAVPTINKLSVHFNIFCFFQNIPQTSSEQQAGKNIHNQHTPFIRLWGNIAAPTKCC